MNTGDPDFTSASRFKFSTRQQTSVHVLGEYVFCPRAAVIASESGGDAGDEEPNLGPRLDLFVEYNEHRFVESLQESWGSMRLWLTLMALALFTVMLAGYLHSMMAAVVLSLPIFVLLSNCWETLTQIIALVREHALYRAAPDVVIDIESTETRRLSWWSLRKAGFDCNRPLDILEDPARRLSGKPWRLLKKGSLVIPVIRRYQGNTEWGTQHEVRLSAYCDLIERSTGGQAPFGVILFAGTSNCVIIHITTARQTTYDHALKNLGKFLEVHVAGNFFPNIPSDNRCAGCPHGLPRKFQQGKTETIANGKPLPAYTTNSHRPDGQLRGEFHCPCGDRFRWVPPHKQAITLGIAKEIGNLNTKPSE